MKLRLAFITFGSLALMLGFQNCSPVQTSALGGSPVIAADNPVDGSGGAAGSGGGGDNSGGSGTVSSGGDNGSGSKAPPSLPDDPKSVADAAALCTKGMDDGVKHIGNLGSQSGGYEAYLIVSMGSAGSLSAGERIFVGLPNAPEVDSIGSISNSLLVICNLHVASLGSVSGSRVVLVNSQIDSIGSWSSTHVFYDGNTILGNAGSVSNSIMTKLK